MRPSYMVAGLLSLVFGASAAPAPDTKSWFIPYPPLQYKNWQITNWALGCSPGGCISDFDIRGHAFHSFPAFNTSCVATAYDLDWVPCKNKDLAFFWDFYDEGAMFMHIRYVRGKREFVCAMGLPEPPYDMTSKFNCTAIESEVVD